MQPHDMAFLLAGLIEKSGDQSAAEAHAGHRAAAGVAGAWTPPPMHPQVAMPPALMTLRPDVSSYLPSTSDGDSTGAARASCCGLTTVQRWTWLPHRCAACCSGAQ